MGRYGDLREAYLKEKRQQFYQELKVAGKLREHCLEMEEQALKCQEAYLQTGMYQHEAEEMARALILDQ